MRTGVITWLHGPAKGADRHIDDGGGFALCAAANGFAYGCPGNGHPENAAQSEHDTMQGTAEAQVLDSIDEELDAGVLIGHGRISNRNADGRDQQQLGQYIGAGEGDVGGAENHCRDSEEHQRQDRCNAGNAGNPRDSAQYALERLHEKAPLLVCRPGRDAPAAPCLSKWPIRCRHALWRGFRCPAGRCCQVAQRLPLRLRRRRPSIPRSQRDRRR